VGGKAVGIAIAVLAGLAAVQQEMPALEVVRVAHADAGGTSRFDLGLIEKNYRNAAADLKAALSRFEIKAPARIDENYDAGLPDSTRITRRSWRPPKPIPEPLRGITIYVVTVDRAGHIQGLTPDTRKSDLVLISRAARLKDCSRLGRATFLTRELAARLGIRTSRARCVVSTDGTEIEITEGDRP